MASAVRYPSPCPRVCRSNVAEQFSYSKKPASGVADMEQQEIDIAADAEAIGEDGGATDGSECSAPYGSQRYLHAD